MGLGTESSRENCVFRDTSILPILDILPLVDKTLPREDKNPRKLRKRRRKLFLKVSHDDLQS